MVEIVEVATRAVAVQAGGDTTVMAAKDTDIDLIKLGICICFTHVAVLKAFPAFDDGRSYF